MKKTIQAFALAVLFVLPATAQVTSALWGVNGDAWDPSDSILRDFTQVGYKGGGTNTIPNWPVGVVVTNFGAIPDDGIDDSQAFMDAIAACPDDHAVLVPQGRYTILQKIEPQRDHFVLRGEDMYESVLFFPKYLSEIYIDEIGHVDGQRNPVYAAFFNWSEGVEKSIENLTFEFREERKNGDWDYPGARAIETGSGLSDSWFRNLYIKNADSAIGGNGIRISVLNIFIDQFNGRQNVEHNLDAYGGILPRNIDYSLFHNIHITGRLLQPIDLNEFNTHNVYSQYRGGEFNDRAVGYHGGSSHYNLYTDLNKGVTQPMTKPQRSDETYWNVNDQSDDYAVVEEEVYNSTNSRLIFVGYGEDWPVKTNDPSLWYEPAAYGQMTPGNLYLAQMKTFGYPLPEEAPAPIPAPYEKDGAVFRILPTDDITPGNSPDGGLNPQDAYLKFDLSKASETNVAHARLRITLSQIANAPFTLSAWSVPDDAWSEESLTTGSAPAAVSELDSQSILNAEQRLTVEFDVTDFVRNELVGGDGVVSLYVNRTEGSGSLSGFWSSEVGVHPELVVERVADPVPGAPGAPKNIGSTPLLGNIILDWDDGPESDVATYTVYRTPYGFGTLPIAGGLVTSDHVDTSSTTSWRSGMMDYRQVYHYWITAVDDHGYESEKSLEFVAATLHPSNSPPAFSATARLLNASSLEAYSESLANKASDPESDPLYFMKVSGPDWLNVALDGTLSGTPGSSDAGTHSFTFQVTAIGGSTQEVFNIAVDVPPVDDPAGAPAAPTGLAAAINDESISLNWNDSGEADLYAYNVYRSTNSGSYGSALAAGVSSSEYVDSTVEQGIIYYYVVTAVDLSSNESADSSAVSETLALVWGTGFDNGDQADSYLSTPDNWDNGLPSAANPGTIRFNADCGNNTLTGFVVTQTAGDITMGGFPQTSITFDGGSWTMNGGSITCRTHTYQGGHVFTLNEGTLSTVNGSDIFARGGELVVNGGVIDGDSSIRMRGGVLTFNGGTVSAAKDFGAAGYQGSGTMNLNGGTISAANFTFQGTTLAIFGGTTAGSATFGQFGGSGHSDSAINMDWLTGTKMTLSMTEETDWAEALWNGGRLTYNGQGVGELGAWAEVTAEDGLEAGVRFEYDSTTKTLSLNTDESVDTTPPVAPTGLEAVAGDGSVSLTWDDNSENDLDSYSVYRSTTSGSGYSELANSLSSSETVDSTAINGTTYYYVVTASDITGNESAQSAEVSASPKEPTVTGYNQWAAEWGVGVGSADDDSDGMNNFHEYAMGGNPTNAAEKGSLPVFSKFGNGFMYVHPQRSDDMTLTYRVETVTNLISGTWTNEGFTVMGTNVTGGAVDFVTNDVGTIEKDKFIRLRIE